MILVEAMGRRGEGVVRRDGRPAYIPYALPGEVVRADIAGERGTLLEVIEASPERVAPFCPHHGRCGGCILQHWAAAPYAEWKRGLVDSALRKLAIVAAVSPLVAAHGAGRRRVSLHARRENGAAVAGFMRLRSHALHDIDACPILEAALAPAAEIARAVAAVCGDTDVAMTATQGGIDACLKGARAVTQAQRLDLMALARRWHLARLSLHHEPLIELAAPAIAVGRVPVRLPPLSFLQATRAGEEALAGLVVAALGRAKRVADLFCGLGPFALRLAERAQVEGFDNDATAIDALTRAARTVQGLKPLRAESRDLFRDPLTLSELAAFDAVVFDPPRAGAGAQARQLARTKLKTIVAVSCDPASFARDAAILLGGGYRLEAATPVDQFAWSAHVEIVGVFRR